MEDVPNPKLVDGRGDPVAPHIEVALTRLLPQFQQKYPALRDDLVRAEVARRGRATHRGARAPVRSRQQHLRATRGRRSATPSRRGSGKAPTGSPSAALSPEHSEAVLGTLETSIGTPEQIEQEILLGEVMAQLTPEERFVVTWKAAGYSSEEIAKHRGTSAAAVDTLFSRAKDKIRAALGVDKKRRFTKPMGRPALE